MREHINVNKLMEAILKHVSEGNLLTRFANRFLPVFILQKANIEDFKLSCIPELKSRFSNKQLTWCLEFKSRNNQKAVRSEYYAVIKECIASTNLNHTVSFDDAELEVLVECFRDILIFCILPGYKATYKKYNMQAL